MLMKNLLTLAVFTASAAALRDPTLAREYPRSANEGTAVAPNNCTAVHHISELKSLSGWHALTKYLTESQLMSPSIGKGNSGVTTVAACVGRGPFTIKAGKPKFCTGRNLQTFPKSYAPGVVHLGYTAGFSTRVTMTTRRSAIFSTGISASVDLALPAFGVGSVGMLAHALVPSSVGSNFTAIATSSDVITTLSLYSNANSTCALRYHISSCSAPATAKIPFVLTGWLLAIDASNNTVRVNLGDVVDPAGRSSYMELEGELAYHTAGGYDAYCDELTV
ncbi:hypothetical protein B0H16DRAFT_1814421 [Mycena metata]|uniref:Uncharacterized protein n=1 Tax=Mycena metata TaxID=1033252 RepID=A0AAD7ME70_9AGAR|nr:hypothetical protein B0H16DRAFT_1814421 [Mycena metata]